jgi:hypothetical protein
MASQPQSANFDGDDSHKLELLVSRTTIREKQRKALRLHIGRGRRFSVKETSEGSGVPERQIEAAMCFVDDEGFRPLSLENLASLNKFLGASFASAHLEACGLGAFELMDGQIPLPKVLATADAPDDPTEERKRLIRRLAELEGL